MRKKMLSLHAAPLNKQARAAIKGGIITHHCKFVCSFDCFESTIKTVCVKHCKGGFCITACNGQEAC
jgi:hypothetical protein